MSDDVEFSLGLNGDLGVVARKMAADLKALEQELNRTKTAAAKLDSGLSGKAKGSRANDVKAIQDHDRAIRNLRRSNLQGAPAMRYMGSMLRGFGAHGSTLRRFTVDAAKMEVAMRRLYRLRGGGLRGAGAVAGSLASRAWNGGGRAALGGALWSGAKGAAGMAAGGAALAAGGAAAGIGILEYQLGGAAIEAERVKFALDSVTKGQGAAWWRDASGYARDFGFNVSETANSLMKMKASGFSDTMSKDLFLRMGDLRSVGAGEGEIDRALLAIRQIKSLGRLMGEELNQLTEAGVDTSYVYDALSKNLKKTVPEIIQMKEAGKLTSDIVLPAISQAIGAKTGGMAAGEAGRRAAGSTVSGAWGRLKGSWSVRAADSVDSESLGGLRKGITDFTSWLDGPGGEKTVGAFSGMLGRLFQSAPDMIEKLIWLLDTGLPEAWEGFTAGWESSGAGTAMDNIASGFRGMAGPDGENAKASLRGLGSDVGVLAGSLATLCGWIVKVTESLGKLGNTWEAVKWVTTIGSSLSGKAGAGVASWMFGDGGENQGLFGGGLKAVEPANSNAGSLPMLETAPGGDASNTASGGGLSSVLDQGIPRVEDAARVAVVSQIPKMAAPVIHQSNTINVSGADAASPEAIASATNDRSERGLTSLFSQLGYSMG